MKSFYIIILGIVLNVGTVYGQSADMTRGCIPLRVQFTGVSGLGSYFWQFGDGATSTLANPMHTYTRAGRYTAILSEGPNGARRGEIDIVVYADPEISVAVSQGVGCAPMTVDFTSMITIDPELTITSYFWTFGDGSTSTIPNPTHTYNLSGIFDVSLRVETDITECNITKVFEDLVNVDGTPADFNFTVPSLCAAPVDVSFQNLSANIAGYTYSWDYGNGTTSSAFEAQTITYDAAGTYPVKLTVTSPNGCVSTKEEFIQVGQQQIRLDIPDTLCFGTPTVLSNATAAVQHIWFVGEFGSPGFSNRQSPLITFTKSGVVNIRYTANFGDNCTLDTTLVVFVEQPDASYTIDPMISCLNPMIYTLTANNTSYRQYVWNGDRTNSPTYVDTFLTVRDSMYLHQRDLINTRLTVISNNGCEFTTSEQFIQRRPNAEKTVDLSRGCAPLEVRFQDISTNADTFITYKWLYGTGDTLVNDGSDNTYIYTEPGEYDARLIVETPEGCIDTSTRIRIYVGEPQNFPPISLDTTICIGESLSLGPYSGGIFDSWHYTTDDGRNGDCYDDTEMTTTFDAAPGVYDIVITREDRGCYSDTTLVNAVTVRGAKADIGYQIDCDNQLVVPLRNKSIGGDSFTWFIEGLGDTTYLDTLRFDASMDYVFPETGAYKVTLVALDSMSGCEATLDSQVITPTAIQAAFSIPEIVCDNEEIVLDASQSIDVNASCFRGYLWTLPYARPREVSKDTIHYTFLESGPAEVALTVEDLNGCTHTVFDSTRSYGIEPFFTADPTRLCIPAEIAVSNQTTSDTTIVSWRWNLGSTVRDPGTLMMGIGNQMTSVRLEVEDVLGCKDEFEIPLEEYVVNSQIIVRPGRTICIGDTVFLRATDFTDEGSFLLFDWDLDIYGSANTQETFFIADRAGQVNVRLSYEEASSGCGGSRTVVITVRSTPEAAFISDVDGQNIICSNTQINFTNQSTGGTDLTYFWDFDGPGISDLQNPSIGFGKGTYEVTLTATNGQGCSNSAVRSYTLVGPDGDFTIDQDAICIGETINFGITDTTDIESWTWNFGDGTEANDVGMLPHTFDSIFVNDTAFIDLILRSRENGCEFIITKPITVRNTEADFTTNDSIHCIGQVAILNQSENADRYSWNLGNGRMSNLVNPVGLYEAKGVYQVQLIAEDVALGCKDTIVKNIIIDSPSLGLETDGACEGDAGVIMITSFDPGATYTITPNPDGQLEVDEQGNINVEVTSTTQFIISTEDNNGCEAIDTITYPVFPMVDSATIFVVALPDRRIPLTLPIDEALLGSLDITWSPADSLSCTTCPNPILTVGPGSRDLYKASIMDSDETNCINTEIRFRIQQLSCDLFPNAFTPNNDGPMENEAFGLALPPDVTLPAEFDAFQIFDRWGTKVFDNKDRGSDYWNGVDTDGTRFPSDVYSWYAILNVAGEELVCKGNVTLIR